MKTVFLRALEAEDKAEDLASTIRESGQLTYTVDAKNFNSVPRSPLRVLGERSAALAF